MNKNQTKRINNIVIILIFLLVISSVILPRSLNDLDEIWNYNFARNIADGKLPYKDFNMITTPLLPIICGIILKITFNELIVMRILAILLITFIFYVIYKILDLLEINKNYIYISIGILVALLYKKICIDYNFAILLITLIAIYFDIKTIKKEKEIITFNAKKDIALGILIGNAILLKQTVGVIISIIFIFNKILVARNKEDYKKALKIILFRFIGVIIPIAVLLIYLITNNMLNEFLDYTVFSIKTFDNKIPYINLLNRKYGIIISLLSIIVPLSIILMYVFSICKYPKIVEQKVIFTLFTYSVGMFIMVYPISDSIHFLIASMPCFIAILYAIWIIIDKISRKIKQEKLKLIIKYYIQSLIYLTVACVVLYSGIEIVKYLKVSTQYKELKHFKYIQANSKTIDDVSEYIVEQEKNNKNVYILDATAAMYMIPIDHYNKDYDLFLKGNLGSKGEEGQIEKLKQKDENTIVLIINENYGRNWQNPEKVRNYIVNNWTKIGEIYQFDIYEREGLK